MRITRIIAIGLILCLTLCIDQLSAGRCLRNKGKRNPCVSNGPVCCNEGSFTHCVRKKTVRIDRKKTKQWVLCDSSKGRKFKKCSCMIGCRVTEYTSKGDHTIYFIPVKTDLRIGCKVYYCRGYYFYSDVPYKCTADVKQTVGSCFSLYRGKK